MGCGLCAPKAAQYKSSAVSPSGQSVGKAFSEEAHASASRVRPDSWRAGREAPVTASDAAEEAPEGPREGPRDAAEAEPSAQVDLPGMPQGKAAESSPVREPEGKEAKEAAKTEIQVSNCKAEDEKCEPASARVQVPAVRPKSSPKAKASSPKAASSPTEAKEDSSDESVDEEEMEATLRAVASVLTPRRQSEEGKVPEASVPLPPPRKVSAVSGQLAVTARSTRPLYEITSPMSKPQVDSLPFPSVTVSTSTQLLLLKWARWGRNNCRIKQEEQIKSMQHRRFPRSPPPVQLSPQPTPRESIPRGSASGGASPDSSPPRTGAAAWRAGGELGMGTTVHSREGGSPGRAFDLAELREDQRDSMAQQGTRMKLTRGLGGGAAQAHSLGTPGFGVDTPGFPGGSGVASADASVVSSGVASPVKGGVMSPWILEAEALCEETEDEGSPGGGGWGLEPEIDSLLMLEQEILGKRSHAVELHISKDLSPLQPKEEDQPVLDEDELQQVELFEESPSKKSVEAASERLQDTPYSEPHQVPEDLSSALAGFEYVIGEQVSHYSASHGAWMPAKIVERKSRTIYVIDKQMRGCLAKVRASELVSEKEEKSNPVLRAFTMLEKSEKKQKKRPPSARSSTSASSKPRSATPAAPAVTVPGRGRIVRDDFSDEED